jgi:tetratricopeptide (TPR) repeat protein
VTRRASRDPGARASDRDSAQIIMASGGSVAANQIGHVDYHQPLPPLSWPARVGQVPALASAFQDRAGLRQQVQEARSRAEQVVLTQVLSGGGGVGKTQLAASYGHAALDDGTDLVVWAEASATATVIDAFARAAVRVQAAGLSGNDAETDARAFLDWAATTSRTWLVILDDITDPAALADWWPASRAGVGWVLATTRRRDAVLSGAGRTLITVDTFTRDQSLAYLTQRLTDAGQPMLLDEQADELVNELGDLPLALSHAAAYLLDQQINCASYLHRYRTGLGQLDDLMPASADTDGYGRTVATTLLLALHAADASTPVGLATPAIRLAALLDPAGHPAAVWATEPVTDYMATAARHPVTAEQTRDTLVLLHRYALADFDGQGGPRAVRVHALTARAARETIPADSIPAITHAAASALRDIWPESDHAAPALAESLRANASQVTRHGGDILWQPAAHSILFRAGTSLLNAGLHSQAIAYWNRTAAKLAQMAGPKHPDTLIARANLASSYWLAGQNAEAIKIQEQVAAVFLRRLGHKHPVTLAARGNLASSYRQAGRIAEAITIDEQVAAQSQRLLGPRHPSTLINQSNLAGSYWLAGRKAEAIKIQEQVAADREQVLGPEHPDTLTARANLANFYQGVGRIADAITIEEQVAADRERLLGPNHPDTPSIRGNLANSYRLAGRIAEAIKIHEQVAGDFQRLLGAEHPRTLDALAHLASCYRQDGQIADAITIEEQVATQRERVLGPNHVDTLKSWGNLASSYQQTGRITDAIKIEERVAAEFQRLLGGEHPHTLTARGNLACSYQKAGRTADAITIEEQVSAEHERLQGREHPRTLSALKNLAFSYRQAGRAADAITVEEQVAACDSNHLR